MTANAEAARAFQEIADLLDLLGEKFKPEAYRRAARSIESLTEDIEVVAKNDQLREVPGVGEAIEEKIREFLRLGTIPYLEKLRAQVPAGVLELMRIPGVGPKTARRFWTDLGVESPGGLREAIDAGQLNGVAGFGPTKIAKIRGALDLAATEGTRRPLLAAAIAAEGIVAELSRHAPIERIEVAGSLRRRRETIGDLDILVISAEPAKVLDAFGKMAGVTVSLRGPTKETIRTAEGLQVDLRVLAAESFGAAWQYFTGSKDHNVQTRSLARDRGLKINEYAVMRGEERLASSTEEEIYRSIDLAWIPPEIREGLGEVEAAGNGKLPKLLETQDVVGELHLHLPAGVDRIAFDALAESAKKAGLQYLGVLPAAETDAERLRAWAREHRTPKVLVGAEAKFGSAPEGNAEFRIWSASGVEAPAKPAHLPTSEIPEWVAHFGSDPSSPAGPKRLAAWVGWALAAGRPLEVNPAPGYDGLDAVTCRRLVDGGGRIVVSEHGVAAERRRALAV
ncbi:MAG TPA: helix-hairpin-helix domain-containing protein, partial [Thermoplasmata archaeon]|nr:helix-hairpin-helix domain-containing protein [Thermoplasmata archaeon]